MTVDVLIETRDWSDAGLEALATQAVAATLAHFGYGENRVVSVLGCTDARIATLNAGFRGKPQPTNVLSWPSEERGADKAGDAPAPLSAHEDELGDIAIAYGICRTEAATQGLSLAAHATHLLVHGTLHLLGYDHERDADAALMEEIEAQVLGTLGIANPYSEEA